MDRQLQQQQEELFELRSKVQAERERLLAERSLKNTEISRFSEFQSQGTSFENRSSNLVSPKADSQMEMSQYIDLSGGEPYEDLNQSNAES